MMILEGEILQNPQTWFTVIASIVVMVATFLFAPNGYFNKITESKEKKEERLESAKDAQITALSKKIDELTAKLNDAMGTIARQSEEIHSQTIEIQKLRLQIEVNSKQLKAINDYMQDTDPDNHIIKFIKNSTS